MYYLFHTLDRRLFRGLCEVKNRCIFSTLSNMHQIILSKGGGRRPGITFKRFSKRDRGASAKSPGCAFLYCLPKVAQTLYTTGLRFILVLHLFT